jgi:hypothetical protein
MARFNSHTPFSDENTMYYTLHNASNESQLGPGRIFLGVSHQQGLHSPRHLIDNLPFSLLFLLISAASP